MNAVSGKKTTADYAAIAVAPLLIFLMISSLANFLMLMLYHGAFAQRVSWTLMCFTFGAVAIARLSIEKDRGYSLGYLGILGFVTFIAMMRFVGSPIFSGFILALIAFLADRIVHDCTLIDESVDASGQGLMDSGGQFVRKQIDTAKQSSEKQSSEKTGVSDQVQQKTSRKVHQPGRTVMYLALAALPLFGVGQFFMRSDPATWSRALWLLAVYLFSSLSLLVTTSFLGLRRYLRQRHAEMPSDVSVGWIAGGLMLIALILSIAYLAPLPGQALASFEMPELFDPPTDQEASKYGWGGEAAGRKSPGASTTAEDKKPEGKEVQEFTSQEGAPKGPAQTGNRKTGPSGQKKGGKQQQGNNKDQQGKGEAQNKQRSAEEKGEPKQSEQQTGKQQSSKQQTSNSSEERNESKPQESEQTDRSKPTKSSPEKGDKQDRTSEQNQDNRSGEDQPKRQEQAQNDNDSSKQENSEEQNSNSEASEDSNELMQSDEGDDDTNAKEPKSPEIEQEDTAESDDESTNDAPDAESETESTSDPESASESQPEDNSSGMLDAIKSMVSMFASAARWIIILILAGIVIAFLWINRGLLSELWNRLFGRQSREEIQESSEAYIDLENQLPKRPFSSYTNPIGVEKDARRIVVVTYQAFDAWARETGYERRRDETPGEFLLRIGGQIPSEAPSANRVVAAYNRVVYGGGSATPQDVSAAQQLWQQMQLQPVASR